MSIKFKIIPMMFIIFLFACENSLLGDQVESDSLISHGQLPNDKSSYGQEPVTIVNLYANCLNNIKQQSSLNALECAKSPHVDAALSGVFEDVDAACSCSGAIYQHRSSDLFMCTNLSKRCGSYSVPSSIIPAAELAAQTIDLSDYNLVKSSMNNDDTTITVVITTISEDAYQLPLFSLGVTASNIDVSADATHLQFRWEGLRAYRNQDGTLRDTKDLMYGMLKFYDPEEEDYETPIRLDDVGLNKKGFLHNFDHSWLTSHITYKAKPYYAQTDLCAEINGAPSCEFPLFGFVMPKIDHMAADNILRVTSTSQGPKLHVATATPARQSYDITYPNYYYDVLVEPGTKYTLWIEADMQNTANPIHFASHESPKVVFSYLDEDRITAPVFESTSTISIYDARSQGQGDALQKIELLLNGVKHSVASGHRVTLLENIDDDIIIDPNMSSDGSTIKYTLPEYYRGLYNTYSAKVIYTTYGDKVYEYSTSNVLTQQGPDPFDKDWDIQFVRENTTDVQISVELPFSHNHGTYVLRQLQKDSSILGVNHVDTPGPSLFAATMKKHNNRFSVTKSSENHKDLTTEFYYYPYPYDGGVAWRWGDIENITDESGDSSILFTWNHTGSASASYAVELFDASTALGVSGTKALSYTPSYSVDTADLPQGEYYLRVSIVGPGDVFSIQHIDTETFTYIPQYLTTSDTPRSTVFHWLYAKGVTIDGETTFHFGWQDSLGEFEFVHLYNVDTGVVVPNGSSMTRAQAFSYVATALPAGRYHLRVGTDDPSFYDYDNAAYSPILTYDPHADRNLFWVWHDIKMQSNHRGEKEIYYSWDHISIPSEDMTTYDVALFNADTNEVIKESREIVSAREYSYIHGKDLPDGSYYLQVKPIFYGFSFDTVFSSPVFTIASSVGEAAYDPDVMHVTLQAQVPSGGDASSVSFYRDGVLLNDDSNFAFDDLTKTIFYTDKNLQENIKYTYTISVSNAHTDVQHDKLIDVFAWVPAHAPNITVEHNADNDRRLRFSWESVHNEMEPVFYELIVYHNSFGETTTTVYQTTDSVFHLDSPLPGIYSADLISKTRTATSSPQRPEKDIKLTVVDGVFTQPLVVSFNQDFWHIKIDWESLVRERIEHSASFIPNYVVLERLYNGPQGAEIEVMPIMGNTANIKSAFFDHDIAHGGMYKYRLVYLDEHNKKSTLAESDFVHVLSAKPTVLASFNAPTNNIALSWYPSPGAILFSFFRKQYGAANYNFLGSLPAESNAFFDDTAIDDMVYSYKVVAFFPNGEKLLDETYAKFGYPCGSFNELDSTAPIPDVCTTPDPEVYKQNQIPEKNTHVSINENNHSFTNPDNAQFPLNLVSSTNEKNVYKENIFDWRTSVWRSFNHNTNEVEYFASPFFSSTESFPFSGGLETVVDHSLPSSLDGLRNIIKEDSTIQHFLPSTGWELIKANLGYSTIYDDGKIQFLDFDIRNAGIDSVLLYNRLHGKLRVIIRHKGAIAGNKMKICLSKGDYLASALPVAPGTQDYPINNNTAFAFQYMQPMSDPFPLSDSGQVINMACTITGLGSFSDFSFADFDVYNYDMCTPYYPSQLKLQFMPYQVGALRLGGAMDGFSRDIDSNFISNDIHATYMAADPSVAINTSAQLHFSNVQSLKRMYATHTREMAIEMEEDLECKTTRECQYQTAKRVVESARKGANSLGFLLGAVEKISPMFGVLMGFAEAGFNVASIFLPEAPQRFQGTGALPEAMPTISQHEAFLKGEAFSAYELSRPLYFTLPGSKDQLINSSNIDMNKAIPTAYKDPLGIIGIVYQPKYTVERLDFDSANTFGLDGSQTKKHLLFGADFTFATFDFPKWREPSELNHYSHSYLYPVVSESTSLTSFSLDTSISFDKPQVVVNPSSGLSDSNLRVVISIRLKDPTYWEYEDVMTRPQTISHNAYNALPSAWLGNERWKLMPDPNRWIGVDVLPSERNDWGYKWGNAYYGYPLINILPKYSGNQVNISTLPECIKAGKCFRNANNPSTLPFVEDGSGIKLEMFALDYTRMPCGLPEHDDNPDPDKAECQLAINTLNVDDLIDRTETLSASTLYGDDRLAPYGMLQKPHRMFINPKIKLAEINGSFQSSNDETIVETYDMTHDLLISTYFNDIENGYSASGQQRKAEDESNDAGFKIGFRSSPLRLYEIDDIAASFTVNIENCSGECILREELFTELFEVSYNFMYSPEFGVEENGLYALMDRKTGEQGVAALNDLRTISALAGYAANDPDLAQYASKGADTYVGLGAFADIPDTQDINFDDDTSIKNYCLSDDYKGKF